MYEQNNKRYIEEDEIDLRELFKTIWDKKVFIVIFTAIVTVAAIVYALMKTPIYEAKMVVEIGIINSTNGSNNNNNNNNIENPNNLIKRLQMMYMNNISNEQSSTVTDISLVKGTANLVEITVQAIDNSLAKQKLDDIIKDVKQVHDSKIADYKSLINTNINNLKQQRAELEDEKNRFEGSQALKYELTTTLNQLSLSISSYNITPTKMLDEIMTNESPIKPKKKLIVVVAFVTGFILSIFVVFFMQFITKSYTPVNESE